MDKTSVTYEYFKAHELEGCEDVPCSAEDADTRWVTRIWIDEETCSVHVDIWKEQAQVFAGEFQGWEDAGHEETEIYQADNMSQALALWSDLANNLWSDLANNQKEG